MIRPHNKYVTRALELTFSTIHSIAASDYMLMAHSICCAGLKGHLPEYLFQSFY